jgi:Family of unknown function (DUF5675)
VTVTVTRNPAWSDDTATEGMLDLDGLFQAYTLENTQFLIPEGEYDLVWYPSGRFKTYVPQVMVPDRTNIEIHPANWPEQLDGCTAVGERRLTDAVEQSEAAFNDLKAKLELPCKIVYTSLERAVSA